jgi:hypothetical protein
MLRASDFAGRFLDTIRGGIHIDLLQARNYTLFRNLGNLVHTEVYSMRRFDNRLATFKAF